MNNLRHSIPLLFIVISLSSQDFDERYLESLPKDIRQDILDRSSNNVKEQDPQYRASQLSSKLSKEEDLLKLKNRIENDLLELEKRLSDDEQPIMLSDDLIFFGKDFFNSVQTSFMPINEPNLDASYTIDFGDVLEIQFVGQIDEKDDYDVQRDGSISLPNIGKIYLAGLNLDNAKSLIKSKIKKSFVGTEAFITITNIKDVNILVSGGALNPGIYTLSGNSNILQAISMAGGISEYGSYREINLIRNNEVIESLDLYDLLINGKYDLSKRLRSGDVVHVESRKKIVSINGAVKRPAKYELKNNQKLDDVLVYANNLSVYADLDNISLERILDKKLTTIPVVNISQFSSIEAKDGDLIYIRKIPYREAKIDGAIYKPGSYIIYPGETIDDLIIKAGGYTNNAYAFGAVYENNDALNINKLAKNVLYNEFLDNIIQLSQQNVSNEFDISPIIQLTTDIKNAKPNGRVVIDLTSDEESLKVRDGDRIIIPESPNHIYVYGEVSSEGAVLYEDANNNVEFYIDKSGGYKKFAQTEAVYILHPNGETQRFSKKRNIFASQPNQNINLYPGSIIFVPRKLDDSVSNRIAAQAYVSILGNIGIALASLSSINNNW